MEFLHIFRLVVYFCTFDALNRNSFINGVYLMFIKTLYVSLISVREVGKWGQKYEPLKLSESEKMQSIKRKEMCLTEFLSFSHCRRLFYVFFAFESLFFASQLFFTYSSSNREHLVPVNWTWLRYKKDTLKNKGVKKRKSLKTPQRPFFKVTDLLTPNNWRRPLPTHFASVNNIFGCQ